MKNLLLLFAICPVLGWSQTPGYKLSSFLNTDLSIEKKAPNTHYIGNAWLNRIVIAEDDFAYNITQATFSADSTLDWHKHSTGQVLIVISGKGFYQERGKEVIVLEEGSIVKCDKDTEHWHSSTPEHNISYLAIYGASETIWTEKLSKQTYDQINID